MFLTAVVVGLGAGSAAVVHGIASSFSSSAADTCNAQLTAGQQLLDQGESDAALNAFQAVLDGPLAGLRAKLLRADNRRALRCRACIGAARAVLAGRPQRLVRLDDALAFAERATEAANRCAELEQTELLPLARHVELDVLLAQCAVYTQDGLWPLVHPKVKRAEHLAANAEERALVQAAREAARRGEFSAQVERASKHLTAHEWKKALSTAEEALEVASGADERAQAQQLRRRAQQGAFDAKISVALSYLQQRQFLRAKEVALEAQSAAFDAATHEQAAEAIANARLGLFQAALADSDASAAVRNWKVARDCAERARLLAANEQERAAAAARGAVARVGEYNELVAKAEAALQSRAWRDVILHADAALRLAEGDAETARAEQLSRSGKQGAFDAALSKAQAHLQQRRFVEGEREARAAESAAFDDLTRQQAAAVLADARRGLFQAAINKSAADTAQRQWDSAINAAESARRYAATAADRLLVDERLEVARAGKCDALLVQAATHQTAGRWDEASNAAQKAYDCANDDERIRRANDAIEAVRRARDAAEAAEPWYVDAVDDFIRRRPDFSSDEPLRYECDVALIAKKCRKPAAIPHEVIVVLRRHADIFTVVRGGAAVRLTRLTPWRGAESHRVFGEFRCSRCKKQWKSSSTFCDQKQACQGCDTWCYPYAQRPLERRGSDDDDDDDDRRPHDMARCERCRRLGRCCVPNSTAATGYAATGRTQGRDSTGRGRGAGRRGRGRGRGRGPQVFYGGGGDAYEYDDWD